MPFLVTDPDAAVDRILRAIANRESLPVRLWNAYCVGLTAADPSYRRLASTGLFLPDGAPVAWWMKLRSLRRRTERPERTRGPSLFLDVIRASIDAGVHHAFIGGTPETMTAMEERLRAEFPGIAIVLAYAPPFGPVTDELVADVAERVTSSQADIVWLGLGTPKQDYLATELAPSTNLPVLGVGAAFDFVAGSVAEAPRSMQRLGLEWAYRFVQEPRRLWRRYTIGSIWYFAALMGVRRGDA